MTPQPHGFWRSLNLWKMVFFDARTPTIAKLLLVFGALYGLSPLDLIPDFIPVLGQLDDLGVIIFVILAFIRMTKTIREDLWKRSAYETTAHTEKHHSGRTPLE